MRRSIQVKYLIMLFLICFSVVIADDFLGDGTPGGLDTNAGDRMQGYEITTGAGHDGWQIDSVLAYCGATTSTCNNPWIIWAAYETSGGSPTTQLCIQSAQEQYGGDDIWFATSVAFSSHSLEASTLYVIAQLSDCCASDRLKFEYRTTGADMWTNTGIDCTTFPTMPQSYDSNGTPAEDQRQVTVGIWISEPAGEDILYPRRRRHQLIWNN